MDTQAAGAGIKPRALDTVDEQMRKHAAHYIFSPGETLALGDRQLSTISVPQGRLTLIESHTYLDRNRSADYIRGEDKNEFIPYTKSALDSVRELTVAFLWAGMAKAFIIKSLTGVSPEKAAQIESVLVPELPSSLKRFAQHLLGDARRNIEVAGLQGSDFELADAVRKEMLDAVNKVIKLQSAYLNKTERELINSRKPNGRGKSDLDKVDRHYYRMLERKVPLESDLDFVAEQEIKAGKSEGQDDNTLADAIKMLVERVGPSPAQDANELAEVKAELKKTQERFNKLIEMVETGEVKTKSKSK